MKLIKFTKNKKYRNIIIGSIVGIILLIGGITLYRTFALYEEKREFNVLRGRVPDFRESSLLSEKVKLGEYIKMTPTSTNYEISTSLTGYSTTQTINPSELNLWRVIDIKEDGTIEMVSEYISSVPVYLSGMTGYNNLVLTLQTIAEQYKNEKFTINTRHVGYNGQTYQTTLTADDNGNATCQGHANLGDAYESKGCGDEWHQKDINLINTALNTLITRKVGTEDSGEYWLVGRYLQATGCLFMMARIVNSSGDIIGGYWNDIYFTQYCTPDHDKTTGSSIRPIVTLKADVMARGTGTAEDPYILTS